MENPVYGPYKIRPYRIDEQPQIGDVIRLFEEDFGDGIITKIDNDQVLIERIYGTVKFGAIQIGVTRLYHSLEIVKQLKVYFYHAVNNTTPIIRRRYG